MLFVRRLLWLCLAVLRRSLTRIILWLFSTMSSNRTYRDNQSMGNVRSFCNSRDFDEHFDSSWEDEDLDTQDDGEDKSEGCSSSRNKAYRNRHAAQDMQNFRHMCRHAVSRTADDDDDDDSLHESNFLPNLHFYQNKTRCEPDGLYIDEIHKKWYGDYSKLEYVHSYIQWLFPTQEHGMNFESYKLTLKEIKLFRKQEKVKERLLKSYKLMLDFYGLQLLSEETGEVERTKNWKERFENLNRNTHNNLRITRILKCLGLLGFEHYQAPLVHFFLQMTLKENNLPRVKQSVLDYFMFSVLDKKERKKLIKFAYQNFEKKYDFVWCPRSIQLKFKMENVHSLNEIQKAESCESVKSDLVPLKNQNDNETPKDSQPKDIQSGDNESVEDGCQDDGGKSPQTDKDSKQEGSEEENGTPDIHEEGLKNEENYASKPNGNMSTDRPVVQNNDGVADDDHVAKSNKTISLQDIGHCAGKPEVEYGSEQTKQAAVLNDTSNNQTPGADIKQHTSSSNDEKREGKTSGSDDSTDGEPNIHRQCIISRGSSQDKPVMVKNSNEATASCTNSANTDKTNEEEKCDGQIVVTNEPTNDQNGNENLQQTQHIKSNKVDCEPQRSEATTGKELEPGPHHQEDES